MKKIILILFLFVYSFLFFIQNVYSQSGWVQQNSGTNIPLSSMSFVNVNTGYIVGWLFSSNENAILKTTNGGINWINLQLDSGLSNNFVLTISVFFINSNTGFIAGDASGPAPIFKTTNGGLNWNLTNVYSSTLWSIYFINDNTGFTVGKMGACFRTTNGGLNWNSLHFTNHELVSIYFINDNTGYTVGGIGSADKIFKTTDCGLNWIDCSPGTGHFYLSQIFAPSINIGYVIGYYGILKTTNSGTNWTSILNNPSNWLLSTYFTSDSVGYVVGGGQLLKTTNGGNSFVNQMPTPFEFFNSVFFINQNTGWTVCDDGKIFKTTTGGDPIGIKPISNEVPKSFSLYQNYPNPFNPSTKIKFDTPLNPPEGGTSGVVTLKIYDILGRELATLVNEKLQPGTYEVEWNSSNYPSGVYFYKIETESFSETKRMVLIK